MKKELKVIILILFILLVIILFGITIFYKYSKVDSLNSNTLNFEIDSNEKFERESNYKENINEIKKEVNEIEKQVQQEFNKVRKESEN